MATLVHAGEKFTYPIPVPSLVRAIVLLNIAILVGLFVGIPLAILGPHRILGSFQDGMLVWLSITGGFGFLIGFLTLLACPPRSFRARLECDSDSVKFFPLPVLRWIGGPTAEARIGQKVKEIVICEGRQPNSLFGFRVLLRAAAGADREIKINNPVRLTWREARKLVEGIATATSLPIRLVKRKVAEDGAIREVSWSPAERSGVWSGIAKVGPAALPFASGFAVGYLHPNLLVAGVAGFGLWLCQILVLLIYARVLHQKRKLAAIHMASTFLTFAASYAATFAFASYIFASKP